MIKSPYNYTPISRTTVDGKRHYCLPDGTAVPSVTTILDRTKSEESRQALQKWRNAIGHDRAQTITTEAANRGTRMHSYLDFLSGSDKYILHRIFRVSSTKDIHKRSNNKRMKICLKCKRR
jgi:hypothetical protein